MGRCASLETLNSPRQGLQWKCAAVQEKAAAHWNEKPDPIAIKLLKLWGNARIIKDMIEGRRVFTDARKGSQSGCKKLGKHGSR